MNPPTINLSTGTIPTHGGPQYVGTLIADGVFFEHPAIEDTPEFLARIPHESLVPACRNFNASVCEFNGHRLLAYRSEAWSGLNSIVIARLDADLSVIENVPTQLPDERGVQYEDPRLCVVDNRLHLICAHVKFGVAPATICRQRLFVLSMEDLQPVMELFLPFGRAEDGMPEKNWMPFELPGGDLGLIYSQRPHVVIECRSTVGHETRGLMEWKASKMVNGRTPPVRVNDDQFLSFFGGHAPHPFRKARYFMGAYLFEARPPFRVCAATKQPLVWGSELSPTFFSARPNSGYPPCIYPSGVIKEGGGLIVSCGVNDSYNVFLKYDLTELLARMTPVDAHGRFAP
jgi:predicted GH43/DUF377 family glycosyl hydrolase